MWLCFHAFLTYFCLIIPLYLPLSLSISLSLVDKQQLLFAGGQPNESNSSAFFRLFRMLQFFSSSVVQLFSCSTLQLFSSSARSLQVQVFFFGCIVIMFAIKLMKSFALLPINLCFAIRIPLLPSHSLPQSRLKVCYLIVQSMPRSKLAGDKLIPNFTSRQQIAFHLFFCFFFATPTSLVFPFYFSPILFPNLCGVKCHILTLSNIN